MVYNDLTTLSPPKHRMGRTAMQVLRRMIEGHPPPEEGYTLVECPLIVRESTARGFARPLGGVPSGG